MKEKRVRKNNRGDSLILVIGCIALLSIVGIVLLAKSMDNQNMKAAEVQAQTSFLGAESGSAELVTVIETVAQEVVGESFGDMLIEYSLLDSNDADADNATAIKERYNQFFSKKVKENLTAETLETHLKNALGVEAITGLSVQYDTVVIDDTTVNGDATTYKYTDTVRIKKVEISYSIGGSQSKITTDICVKALIPDVKAGFNSGISCDFTDFGLIADGDVTVATGEVIYLIGNVYTGGDFVSTIGAAVTNVSKAVKMLVKGEINMEAAGAQLWVKADGVTFQDGQGIWTGGITINGGIVNTDGVNVYVVDDLSVEGTNASVVMKGTGAKYVGFSGGKSNLANHQQSSAITINDAKNLTLDLSNLGGLYINGCSYIYEDEKWGTKSDGAIATAPGVLQGESIAYKNMQGMYLYPGACLPQGHNPIIGTDVSINPADVSLMYTFLGPEGMEYINLANYVNPTTPFVTRTAQLDGGATEATYVYLNFQNEEKAAQFTRDYMTTSKKDVVKNQISSLGTSSTIALPTKTYTLANALSYTSGVVNMLPSADSGQLSMLRTACLLAKQRYRGLFTTLRAEVGAEKSDSYQMAKEGILLIDTVNILASDTGTGLTMPKPSGADNDNFSEYTFYVHNGDLTIDAYRAMNGILIVNGDLTISATNSHFKGLVLVTGKVKMTQGVTIEADQQAVETLLSNEQVAKYFRVYGDKKGQGYLSSESVQISFENWEKN